MAQELKDPYTRSALEASGAAAAPGVEPVSEETIRVLIADDDCSVLDVLSDVVLRDPSLELTATAADADEAIELAARCRPAVALIDVRMPGGGGPRATLEIRRQSPATQVIALSAHRDRRSVLDMIGAGAVGYVVKGPGVEEVLAAIKRSAAGRSTLSPEVAREVIHHVGGQLSRERQEEEQRLQVIDRVREAIDGSVLRMAFQPIACLHTGRVAGYEALARFDAEPVRPPNLWFDEAATVGLRTELEVAAARAALRQLDRLPADAYLSINLSPDAASSAELEPLLAAAPLDRLVIEVTEEAPVEDYDALAEGLAGLRGQGLRLAVDDAGAGFASLRHILRLSPDLIKLDVTLTRGVDYDPPRRALASALISFAAETGATIVAEGIESAAELAALRALGVGYGQGYHLGRPAPLP